LDGDGRPTAADGKGCKILVRPSRSDINFEFVLLRDASVTSAVLANKIDTAAKNPPEAPPVNPLELQLVVDSDVSEITSQRGGSLFVWTQRMKTYSFMVEATSEAPAGRDLVRWNGVVGFSVFVSPELRWFNRIDAEVHKNRVRARVPGVVSGVKQ
jgi:hypothetical protein